MQKRIGALPEYKTTNANRSSDTIVPVQKASKGHAKGSSQSCRIHYPQIVQIAQVVLISSVPQIGNHVRRYIPWNVLYILVWSRVM